MTDPTTVASAETGVGLQGAGVPEGQPATQLSEQGAGKPEGTLPADVHPAVREAREKAGRYRDLAAEAFIFDGEGNAVGIREDFAQRVSEQYRSGGTPAAQPDSDARLERVVTEFANQYGLLPEQVRGILKLVDHVAQQRAREYGAPIVETTLDQMKASMIASGEAPREAAPYIEKWFNEARRANPQATLSIAGRETIMRQAIGEYAMALMRRRAAGQSSAAPGSPNMLRPTPGGAMGAIPTTEEQQLRHNLGLPVDKYGETGPRERP